MKFNYCLYDDIRCFTTKNEKINDDIYRYGASHCRDGSVTRLPRHSAFHAKQWVKYPWRWFYLTHHNKDGSPTRLYDDIAKQRVKTHDDGFMTTFDVLWQKMIKWYPSRCFIWRITTKIIQIQLTNRQPIFTRANIESHRLEWSAQITHQACFL